MRDWSEFLKSHTPSTRLRDELAAIRACELALRAASLGTYGVGAVVLDASGKIVIEGYNEVHVGGFRSDLHAEMVVVNEFERTFLGDDQDPGSFTLVSSLEPCPMCMTRLIFSRIGRIRHVCEDRIGGMVQRKSSLPPVFREITESLLQEWGLAECSDELREAAFHIWDASREELDRKLLPK
ncbi:MAG: hypothetical protein OEU36_16365 [Gammaproteobacteria bacterium]|nr:hypothetical protein [Gammaproteobacteria bacterium]